MFNILLDAPPTEFEGYPINSDFRIGIQITQAMSDEDLNSQERTYVCCYLLFGQSDETEEEKFPPADVMVRGINWFLTGWITDNHKQDKNKKNEIPVMDMDIDQWRIYSAFLFQYGINLNRTKLHYWEFMGLLTTLDECAFTRVVDIRSKKLTDKMSPEMRKLYTEQKSIYSLKEKYEHETAEEKAEREQNDAVFMEKLRKNKQRKKKQ